MTTPSVLRRPTRRLGLAVAGLGFLALAACQTAPVERSGFLSSYEGQTPVRTLRAALAQRRDDAASAKVTEVYIEPAVLVGDAGAALAPAERDVVLREVDRHTCFRVSRHFAVLESPSPDAGTIRTAVVRINPTGRAGSTVSAVAAFFNPVPMVDVRLPGTTGGLAVESELVGPDGSQIAHLTWARNANVVGMDAPSLSRIGDAVAMAEEAGKAIGHAYADKARETLPVGDPDPCRQYGPRRNLPRRVADMAFGALTGLYAPEVSGTARPAATIEVSDPTPVPDEPMTPQ